MRPLIWTPPVALSASEEKVIKRIKRAKLFSFRRLHRHEIFDAAFQQEMTKLFKDSTVGQAPIFPAQLALATILQAYTDVSDDEVIEAMVMDRRWQLVLGTLSSDESPFGKGTFVRFRGILIAKDFDRRLIERTIEIAQMRQSFSPRNLRAALDSSPLWGAARVEDTYNLLGHALRKAVTLIAQDEGKEFEQSANESGAERLNRSSLKAALDIDWDDQNAKSEALTQVIAMLDAVEYKLQQDPLGSQPAIESVKAALNSARQIQQQDVERDEVGTPRLKKSVAKDRRITIEDEQMRHGRKSRAVRIDGYKRHVLSDLDLQLIRAVGITPANAPEATVTQALQADLEAQAVEMTELHIDRAYLASEWGHQRADDLEIICKAWPTRRAEHVSKTDFELDWATQQITCPNGISVSFTPGKTARFPPQQCQTCSLQPQCTTSAKGRTVTIHPNEVLFETLRARQSTPDGRAQLRERVKIEHTAVGQYLNYRRALRSQEPTRAM
ncbi:MAG: IS5/IS1182 family transposase [Cyanothece sp. SIO2G6]|nr:IS5/IS1182 family transposase [Cyanothece sp. SIO2G6]